MFHWRIVNEPGVHTAPSLKVAQLLCFGIGFVGTVVINILFICYKEKKVLIVWILNSIALTIYTPFFLLTLLMMV